MKRLLLIFALALQALAADPKYPVQTEALNPVSGAIPLGNGVGWDAGSILAGDGVTVEIVGTNVVISTSGGVPGSGTVTSITLTEPAAGLTITSSGTPITSSGTRTFALANDLLALEGLTGTGYPSRTGTDAWSISPTIPWADLSGVPSYQPLDSDLTAIAALTTTSFGRSILDDADASAAQATLSFISNTNGASYGTLTVEDAALAGTVDAETFYVNKPDGTLVPLSVLNLLPPLVAADIDDLLAVDSVPVSKLGYTLDDGLLWIYCPLDDTADNGTTIRRPDDIASDATPGRWEQVTTGGGGGGSGDVVGPGSATDNAIVRFNGTTGKLVQNSAATIDDTTGDITAGKFNTVAISGSSTPTLAVTGTTTVSGSNTGDQTSVTGNAGTATAWATGRTIGITGDLTYTSPSLDGTGNVTAAGTLATVNSNVGAFGNGSYIPTITVNAKGLITAVTTNAVTAGGTGDVVGPGSSTDNAVAVFDGTTGKLLQNSVVTIDPVTGDIAGINDFSIANLIVTNPIPVTSGGTGIAAGTSGGIPYFSGSTTIASSAALAANSLVKGGGAGVAPSTITTGTGILTALGINTGTAGSPMILGGNGDIRYKYAPAGFVVDGGGSAVTTGKVKGFTTVRQAGTITAWNIAVDTGTCTVKVWKVATGTAVPTISNVINTSGVSISSGTYVRSTTTSDFTTTSVAANDILAYDITAVSGATEITFGLEITTQ